MSEVCIWPVPGHWTGTLEQFVIMLYRFALINYDHFMIAIGTAASSTRIQLKNVLFELNGVCNSVDSIPAGRKASISELLNSVLR